MSTLLKEQRKILIMILLIFSQKPLVEHENFTSSHLRRVQSGSVVAKKIIMNNASDQEITNKQLKESVIKKLDGTDFGENPLKAEEQADILIEVVTNVY
jgi:hypothetical protein